MKRSRNFPRRRHDVLTKLDSPLYDASYYGADAAFTGSILMDDGNMLWNNDSWGLCPSDVEVLGNNSSVSDVQPVNRQQYLSAPLIPTVFSTREGYEITQFREE